MPTVKTIPATRPRSSAASAPTDNQAKRRVAAYARVSTDHTEQAMSYEAQVDYYSRYIRSRDDWTFAGMYVDEGITGTSTKHREGFKRMVADALNGRIDLIITKSVSRFARNTVDSLTAIRQLKEHGTECYFEKENIWTFDSKGELLITIMSSLAQEESRSISENVIWGHRKRMADGKAMVPFSAFLGYKRGADGGMVIDDEQAAVVRDIYAWFLQGLTPNAIATRLMKQGVPSPAGKPTWYASTVKGILTNEKYKGDALLQKYYIEDFLTKKLLRNRGELPQYLVENDHEAIIPPEQFELVQREIARRKELRDSYSGNSIFASHIICGECGGFYGSKLWHSTDPRYRKTVYRCNAKYGKQATGCKTPYVSEQQVMDGFVIALNRLIAMKAEVIAHLHEVSVRVFDTSELEAQRDELAAEMAAISEEMEEAVCQTANGAVNQIEYGRRYKELADRYDELKAEHDAAVEAIRTKLSGAAATRRFIAVLNGLDGLDGPVTEFDPDLWGNLLDHVTVYTKQDLRYTFRDGTTIGIADEAGKERPAS